MTDYAAPEDAIEWRWSKRTGWLHRRRSWNEIALLRAMRGAVAGRELRDIWKHSQIDEFVARSANHEDPYECLGGES